MHEFGSKFGHSGNQIKLRIAVGHRYLLHVHYAPSQVGFIVDTIFRRSKRLLGVLLDQPTAAEGDFASPDSRRRGISSKTAASNVSGMIRDQYGSVWDSTA